MSTGCLVLASHWLAPNIRRLVVVAPHVIRDLAPGQFVTVRALEDSEPIPLPVAHSDPAAGTILLIVRASGASTRPICALRPGDRLFEVAGPLGRRIDLHNFGHAVVLGEGEGTAFAYSLATGLKACANRVTAVIGAHEREYVILESELNQVCDAVYPCTDDGSYGFSGPVTRRLQQLIDAASPQVNAVFASGPAPLLQAVAELTRPYGIHTVTALDPPVIDETHLGGG